MKTMREQHPQKRVNSRKNKNVTNRSTFVSETQKPLDATAFPHFFFIGCFTIMGGGGGTCHTTGTAISKLVFTKFLMIVK